ncbi:hypothetical protein PQ455_03010 [Sphingomonas naphthae]|uniref:Lipoprotein n=1 Tax=Sphingomonas naphthae TaxID=1813468 RepID=A0ABY7TNB0_9SPHN|nr:hypothetical protein [Sphingomonas naphthae]WCT74216.1 hypothetical protein PQ455_03010 [Sphingomonas naphthae]
MRLPLILIALATLPLAGCDVVRQILPHNKTTALEASEAMTACGIDPDDIAWRVDGAGAFFYGRKSAGDEALPTAQTDCLTKWARDNRIAISTIARSDEQ